jgi:hypothetical protein
VKTLQALALGLLVGHATACRTIPVKVEPQHRPLVEEAAAFAGLDVRYSENAHRSIAIKVTDDPTCEDERAAGCAKRSGPCHVWIETQPKSYVLRHEFGHALGLELLPERKHSDDPANFMAEFVSPDTDQITDAQRKRMRAALTALRVCWRFRR